MERIQRMNEIAQKFEAIIRDLKNLRDEMQEEFNDTSTEMEEMIAEEMELTLHMLDEDIDTLDHLTEPGMDGLSFHRMAEMEWEKEIRRIQTKRNKEIIVKVAGDRDIGIFNAIIGENKEETPKENNDPARMYE